jgi:hypothetical protein
VVLCRVFGEKYTAKVVLCRVFYDGARRRAFSFNFLSSHCFFFPFEPLHHCIAMSPSISLRHHHWSFFSVAVEMPPHQCVNRTSTSIIGFPFRPRCNFVAEINAATVKGSSCTKDPFLLAPYSLRKSFLGPWCVILCVVSPSLECFEAPPHVGSCDVGSVFSTIKSWKIRKMWNLREASLYVNLDTRLELVIRIYSRGSHLYNCMPSNLLVLVACQFIHRI